MKRVACLVVLAAILPAISWADCNYPKKPGRAPDGSRATKDEMLAAMKVNKQYQSDVTAYLDCLKKEHEAELAKNATASDDDKKKMTMRWEKKNDAAVDEAQDVADRFNEQVRAYNAKKDK